MVVLLLMLLLALLVVVMVVGDQRWRWWRSRCRCCWSSLLPSLRQLWMLAACFVLSLLFITPALVALAVLSLCGDGCGSCGDEASVALPGRDRFVA